VSATAVSAHMAGMPVEEALSLALAVGGVAFVGARLAWLRLRSVLFPERGSSCQ